MKNLKQTLAVFMVLVIALLGLSVATVDAAEETPAATVATSGAETGGTILGVSTTTAAIVGGAVVVAAGAIVAASSDNGSDHGHGH